MGCMGGCGGNKTKVAKTKSYVAKQRSSYRMGSSSPFGQPKVRISFSSRGR